MDESFQIFLLGINNKTRTHNISLSTKISDIYEYISKKYNINTNYFYLLHSTKILDNSKNITINNFNLKYDDDAYKVGRGSNIKIIFRSVLKKN
jgi:hypothetical protein